MSLMFSAEVKGKSHAEACVGFKLTVPISLKVSPSTLNSVAAEGVINLLMLSKRVDLMMYNLRDVMLSNSAILITLF